MPLNKDTKPNLTDTATLSQIGPWSNFIDVLHTPQTSRTGASQPDAVLGRSQDTFLFCVIVVEAYFSPRYKTQPKQILCI